MNAFQKDALRGAEVIRRKLAERQVDQGRIQLPEYQWSEMLRLIQQIEQASGRQWRLAARRLTDELLHEVDRCHCRLLDLLAILRQRLASPAPPTPREIYEEILALQDEFEEFELDPKTGEIRVTTEPVVLEGIHLGRFEVRLHWKSPGGAAPYDVIALDPNPAAGDCHVTHPHVQSESLCEGDGRAAVQAALAQGRLTDFFRIVIQILNTYAQGSAYVELGNWDGEECCDCGGTAYEDDRCSCARCGNTLCGECATYCEGCQETYCSACISTCQTCDENYCSSCLEACASCHRATCPDCLEDKLCRRCYEQRQQNDEDDSAAAAKPVAAAAEPPAAV